MNLNPSSLVTLLYPSLRISPNRVKRDNMGPIDVERVIVNPVSNRSFRPLPYLNYIPTANCQTLYINSLDDFVRGQNWIRNYKSFFFQQCLWAPPQANSTIGDTESQEVAWCLKIGHGARIIPANTLTSAHL